MSEPGKLRRSPRDKGEVRALEYLLAEVQRLEVSDAARNEFMRLLRSMAGARVHFSRTVLIKPGRVALAQQLLDQGLSVAQTRQALCERLRLPRRNAYRLISLALAHRFRERQFALFAGHPELFDGPPKHDACAQTAIACAQTASTSDGR